MVAWPPWTRTGVEAVNQGGWTVVAVRRPGVIGARFDLPMIAVRYRNYDACVMTIGRESWIVLFDIRVV